MSGYMISKKRDPTYQQKSFGVGMHQSSPTGCRSDWEKRWALALTTTNTCSMDMNHHSCQTQSDWVPQSIGTQSDWVWHEWWFLFIEQVLVVVRARAQSFTQSDWVPQSDRHPVGSSTQFDWIPSPTGIQLTSHDWNWCIPTSVEPNLRQSSIHTINFIRYFIRICSILIERFNLF
jgi:hypothetical protein